MRSLCLFLIFSLSLTQECQPLGVRASFGEFYTDTQNMNQVYISFNTKSICPNMTLAINNYTYLCNSNMLHIEQENKTVNYTTYVHSCAVFGVQFNDSEVRILPYSIMKDGLNATNKTYTLRLISKFLTGDFKALVVGDWGILDEISKEIYYDIMPCLYEKIKDEKIMMWIYLGDIGYEMIDDNCQRYEQVLKAIEPITSTVPYVTTPGNHDTHNKVVYTLYTNTFFSPFWNQTYNYFYSLNFGGIELVSFNPEEQVYEAYKKEYPLGYPHNNDVKVMDLVDHYYANLKDRDVPIKTRIVMSHYSMYCSNPVDPQCSVDGDAEHLRFYHNIFQANNVSLIMAGHIHVYERGYPINLEGKRGSFKNLSVKLEESVYQDPDSIVFVSEGAGGNSYFVNRVPYPLKEFTASSVQNTGYGVVELQNGLNITYRHYSGQNCQQADSFVIYRTQNILTTLKTKNWIIPVVVTAAIFFSLIFIFYCLRRRKLADNKKEEKPDGIELQEEREEENIEKP